MMLERIAAFLTVVVVFALILLLASGWSLAFRGCIGELGW